MDPCPFCDYLSGRLQCPFVTQGDRISVFVNRAQYEKGALLVIPNQHVETIFDADANLMADLYREAHVAAAAVVRAFGATGLNIFQNNGIVAGQTVPHFHVHVIPRYPGSDPLMRFRDGEFPQSPFEELAEIANRVRAAMHIGPHANS